MTTNIYNTKVIDNWDEMIFLYKILYIFYKEHSLRVKFEAPNFAFSVQVCALDINILFLI